MQSNDIDAFTRVPSRLWGDADRSAHWTSKVRRHAVGWLLPVRAPRATESQTTPVPTARTPWARDEKYWQGIYDGDDGGKAPEDAP
jgi:hypothetical protein